MENTLLVGDFLLVSKLHYGPRTPVSVGVPFLSDFYIEGVSLPFARLPGFDDLDFQDIVVFNYPVEDAPIDRKTHYIKRLMGMPGDSLHIRDKVVYRNGERVPFEESMLLEWVVRKEENSVLPMARLREMGVEKTIPRDNNNVVQLLATIPAVSQIEQWPYVQSVEKLIAPDDGRYAGRLFPGNRGYTPDNYGPIWVPRKGTTITLTNENWSYFRDIVEQYEDNTVRRRDDGQFVINGEETNTYTLKQDYYFVMGDNRDHSADSRFWGFVPEDHIVGKAFLTYFAWDTEQNVPRLNRMLNLIN